MDTLIKFRQKQFGKGQEIANFIKTPAGIISASALGVSSANLATNASRHMNDKKYQKEQIKSMDHLSKSIDAFNKNMDKIDLRQPDKKKGFKFAGFRLKSKKQ